MGTAPNNMNLELQEERWQGKVSPVVSLDYVTFLVYLLQLKKPPIHIG